MREFLKQYLTEKQNGCLQSGRLQEVVAYEKWSLGESYWTSSCGIFGLQVCASNPLAMDAASVTLFAAKCSYYYNRTPLS